MPTNNKKKNNNKKKKQNKKTQPGSGKDGLKILNHVKDGKEAYYDAPIEHRPVPHMAMDDGALLYTFEQLCERTSFTPTEARFAQAYELSRRVEISLMALEKFRDEEPIGSLVQDDGYVKNCIRLIRAVTSTDFRIPLTTRVLRYWPMPSCWSHVVELEPLGSGSVQLVNLGSKDFVVLLATAIRLYLLGSSVSTLQIVHELNLHAEQNPCDSMDWKDLEDLADESDGISPDWLTESYLRFALATVGIKAARRVYRQRDSRRPFPHSPKLTTAFLLDASEIFAEEQCRFQPKSGLGFWNLAWVARQSPVKRNVNGLEAAAESLALYKRCYELADNNHEHDRKEYNDAFLSCNGRIEAAVCLVLGAGGRVAYEGNRGQAQRDMRSKESRGAKILDDNGRVERVPFHILASGDTPEIQTAVLANEASRMKNNVPQTYIAPGETLLVPRWEVLQLWNEAMKGPYDAIGRMGRDFKECVYGEVAGWDAVVNFLKMTDHYEPGRYGVAPIKPGFEAARDKGFEYAQFISCASCGKYDRTNKQCSVCHKVSYCSRECQTSHWKSHKTHCK